MMKLNWFQRLIAKWFLPKEYLTVGPSSATLKPEPAAELVIIEDDDLFLDVIDTSRPASVPTNAAAELVILKSVSHAANPNADPVERVFAGLFAIGVAKLKKDKYFR